MTLAETAAAVADGTPWYRELRTLGEVSAWALIVAVVLWLLYWLPKWKKEQNDREASREAATAARHDAQIEALQQANTKLIDSANDRHARMLDTFKLESAADRAACDERSRQQTVASQAQMQDLGRQIVDEIRRANGAR